jgi:methylthioribose-1-phosphate isomerase
VYRSAGSRRSFTRVSIVQSVRWGDPGRSLVIIDQTRLPAHRVEIELRSLDDVCDAIRRLAVRGAPAIGIAGAMGLVTATPVEGDRVHFLERLDAVATTIRDTRPTAVNLPWALARMLAAARATGGGPTEIHRALVAEASAILDEDRDMCRAIGEHGVSLIQRDARIITHCNTGALATGGIGTALAPIYLAAERGLEPVVFADETRPLLQGSRLTAWELQQAGIPVTIMSDSAAAALIATRGADLVLVGADRIAVNGDVANKIGTYSLAIVAKHHNVPFYVAAPSSTIDRGTADGSAIHIEQRAAAELRALAGAPTAPPDVDVFNPAFDVTPAALISAIITDRGIHRPPYSFA